MYTLKDLLDPNNPLGERYTDYCGLYLVAYDTEPSDYNFRNFMTSTAAEQQIQIQLVKAAIDDTVMLQLECMGIDLPGWMMAGAPDALTHQRWVESGLMM